VPFRFSGVIVCLLIGNGLISARWFPELTVSNPAIYAPTVGTDTESEGSAPRLYGWAMAIRPPACVLVTRFRTHIQNPFYRTLTGENVEPIEQEWLKFVAACFGTGLPKQQYIDLKRTFFGGVKSALHVMSDPSKTPEDSIAQVMEELYKFNEDVKAGRA
jgi:hypothetical protein